MLCIRSIPEVLFSICTIGASLSCVCSWLLKLTEPSRRLCLQAESGLSFRQVHSHYSSVVHQSIRLCKTRMIASCNTVWDWIWKKWNFWRSILTKQVLSLSAAMIYRKRSDLNISCLILPTTGYEIGSVPLSVLCDQRTKEHLLSKIYRSVIYPLCNSECWPNIKDNE